MHTGTFLFLTPGTSGRTQSDASGISAYGCSRTRIPRRPAPSSRGCSPRARTQHLPGPALRPRSPEDLGVHQEKASRSCARRHELQPAAAPSARPAPQGPTRRQRLFRPTAPAVTVAASALQTPVTPHKNNNLLAGVRSGEAVAGAAQQGILGLEVPPVSPARSRRGERTTTPEDSYSPQP